MVESTGLENRQACKRLVGSNPTPSATFLNNLDRRRWDHEPTTKGRHYATRIAGGSNPTPSATFLVTNF